MNKISIDKKKIIIFFINCFLLIGLAVALIVGSVFLANEMKLGVDNSKWKVFWFASLVGVSSFLIILISLNFSTFLTTNKSIIKKLWVRDKHDQ